ncbi:DUF4381 domain-containing protein [Tamlana fucoidanivorans]|uniref:DUF4381 domain-containing protein n=1 Tax=Allotamlana fucoidanivorans TaxID=2583814 RepID=A0A5C4SFW3_9FLAO|nr:DUF4381 domain-containing protein [Tamlana fucoidanivorans]TNJ42512.1 DUF4381 domain-containing protein [Tamlana fucoidanivorans]
MLLILQENTLQPIIEPDPITFTLETLGWKLIGVVLLVLVLFIVYNMFIRYKQRGYRRAAIQEIQSISKQDKQEVYPAIAKVMFLLKQTALRTYSKNEVASLSGRDWLALMDSKVKSSYFEQHEAVISNAVYQNKYNTESSFDIEEFIQTSIKWIKDHA